MNIKKLQKRYRLVRYRIIPVFRLTRTAAFAAFGIRKLYLGAIKLKNR
ncbi:hypothetical protein MUJ63_03230 [Lachnospiraceae bacterium NSJ-143]|nr:hypothetical protein [Lachnospiraceae bacterium NSJ-143]